MGFRGSELRRGIAALLIVLTAAVVSSGCGDSSSDASSTEPSKTFLVKGGENKIPNFGQEASAAEREAASSVLEENLKARAAAEWKVQCASLSSGAMKEVAKLASETTSPSLGVGCVGKLKELGEPLSGSRPLRKNTMTGPIDALRKKGSQAWALYHGDRGKDYAMKMVREGGEWKVGSLTTTKIE